MNISIIIPVYNVEPYIERCLLSALNQTYENTEIILIDDKGMDHSIDIAKDIVSMHPNKEKVKFIYHEFNEGLSSARNSGIKASNGEYIYLLDSDDEMTSDCLEKLVEPAILHNSDFIIGNYEVIGSDVIMPSLDMDEGTLFSNRDVLQNFLRSKWYVMAVNKLVKKKLIDDKQIFFEEGIIHEDELWSFMLACQASSMSVVNATTYKYHIRESSIMGNINSNVNTINLRRSIDSKVSIISLMRDYICSHAKLKKDNLVLNIYEFKKDAFLINIFQTPCYEKKELLKIYKKIRELIYINPLKVLFTYHLDCRTRIKMTHYLFPIKFGYSYYSVLASMRSRKFLQTK